MNYDVLIVGAGPVGIFSAFQCGMCKLSFVVIDSSDTIGGQCTRLYPEKPIYDIPAYKSITGRELIDNLISQASVFNPEYYLNENIEEVKKIDNIFEVKTNNNLFKVKNIILAIGIGKFVHRKPAIELEEKDIYYCINDMSIFENKTVTIFGGGDSAVDWAINLSHRSKKVYLVHRRTSFSAIPSKMDTLKNSGVEVYAPEQIVSFKNNIVELQKISFHSDSIVFCFGFIADVSDLKKLGVEIDNHNRIPVNKKNYMTSIEGIYAVGDVSIYEGKIPYISVGFAECVTIANDIAKIKTFKHSTSTFQDIIKN